MVFHGVSQQISILSRWHGIDLGLTLEEAEAAETSEEFEPGSNQQLGEGNGTHLPNGETHWSTCPKRINLK